jgi:conjugative relaxase-like TrwC/TraI family protein
MRMMGAESVEYHRATVMERADDHPGMALEYYASRGETPLVWGGSGAVSLGVSGPVSPESYETIFGPGGARHPGTFERLVATRRPGMELVISAHKSVAELGVIGRAEDMHAIMDAERAATLGYLDRVTREMGGRRGRAAAATETSGLVYAHTRHATSRAGDPCPHDHVLLANLVEMADERGGWKAADTTLWREHLHAATMIGRVASARAAVELGYGIEADPGPSGKLGHWRIAGIPDEVLELHSKRAAEIEAECRRRGDTSYHARGVAARTTRSAKEHQAEGELVARWRAELAAAGWPVERLAASVEAAKGNAPSMTLKDARRLMSDVLRDNSELARRKVFCRRDVIVAMAPHLYRQDPVFLDVLVDQLLADPEVIPLVRLQGARERAHSLASVIARETAIAESLSRQLDRTDAPAVSRRSAERAIATVEADLGGPLSDEQRQAAVAICTSGRGGELVVGVAGAGKTTMLRVVAGAFIDAGYQVLGTATSGQAARNLGTEADIAESRTLASLIWRLDRGRLAVDDRSVVVCDEVGMTDDVDLARLAAHVEASRAKLVLVGDHRQLAAVGPGGALQALVNRHPGTVHRLVENRRQHDPQERQVLAELRDGDVDRVVHWYEQEDRIHAVTERDAALQAAVDAWAADVAAGRDTQLFAWRRANVGALNEQARAWMQETGRLHGPELVCPGGLAFRAGDQVVALTAGPDGSLVTSERATVEAVVPAAGALVVRTEEGRAVRLAGQQASADRLGYGYATTVHRSQGATVARAHLFADGGGRELAYVAMSRAREETHVWTVADNAAQAREDLRRDWAVRRSPTWAVDISPPAWESPREQLDPKQLEERARCLALIAAKADITRQAATGVRTPDLAGAIVAARTDLHSALRARADLEQGAGDYRDSETGQAVRDLAEASAARQRAEWDARHAPRWRDRHAATKEQTLWAEREADAQRLHQLRVTPELARLDRRIETCRATLEQVEAHQEQYRLAERAVADLSAGSASDVSRLSAHLTIYRNEIDGVPQPPALRPARVLHARQVQVPAPAVEPPIPPPQLGIGM